METLSLLALFVLIFAIAVVILTGRKPRDAGNDGIGAPPRNPDGQNPNLHD